MPVFKLRDELIFPLPELAEPSGLLAVGGDLSVERLLLAFRSGVYPWYSKGMPISWHSPDPRGVLQASRLHLPRSLRKRLRRGDYEVHLDGHFARVVGHCAAVPRPREEKAWLNGDLIDAYIRLHEHGAAHSAEAWRDGRLAGGLFGVSLGGMFAGLSMFALEPDASKVAFATLVAQLRAWRVELIDCQVHTEHMQRFGAEQWRRSRFIEALRHAVRRPTLWGPWELERTAAPGK